MYHKKFCVVIVTVLLLYDIAETKKTRIQNKRTKQEEDSAAPQPDVVSYSTFGVNDVGTYEGFVPTSPDYARFLSANQEEPAKQTGDSYPPTSADSTAYSNTFGPSQSYSTQSFAVTDNGNSQPTLARYPSAPSIYNQPTFASNNPYKNVASEESYATKKEDSDAPIYGTKINSRGRGKPFNELNITEHNEVKISPSDKKYFDYQETKPSYENKPVGTDYSSVYPQFPQYPALNSDEYGNAGLPSSENSLKFQRVVDFTKHALYYPELDTSQMPTPIKPDHYGIPNKQGSELLNLVQTENNNKLFQSTQSFRENYEHKKIEETTEKNIPKYHSYTAKDNTYHFEDEAKKKIKTATETKKKSKDKDKVWNPEGYDYNKWQDHFSPPKGYDIHTDHSNISFKYETDEPKPKEHKRPFNSHFDELAPAESNIDFPSFQRPETDFSKFKKMPSYKVHEEDEFDNFPSFKESFKQNKPDLGKFKTPSSSSYWGNAFPSSDISLFNSHPPKTVFDDVTNEEIVNIQPKRPNKWNFGNYNEIKPNEWSQFGRRPTKSKPWKDWTKQIPTNRFKSEEDLLDLRNQDTSHPSHLPSHQSSYVSDDNDYKKLVEKWRQSYLKSKYRDSLRDYENYAESKPMHVAFPKPYPIEVPHPVIVPVPQPYPVRVPVPKPVAVPYIHELTIPIEKPVPYPVYKKVPYPVEKPVPVPVEKEVAVPVMKPYPVHVPYIRPVFHHTKTRDESEDIRHDDDYFPRPEGNQKGIHYRKKKPQGSRDRRRPSRTIYHQERNRRRWPDRRHPTNIVQKKPTNHPLHQRHREYEAEGYGEGNEYYNYCRKTGNC